jgi:hypothetical protein
LECLGIKAFSRLFFSGPEMLFNVMKTCESLKVIIHTANMAFVYPNLSRNFLQTDFFRVLHVASGFSCCFGVVICSCLLLRGSVLQLKQQSVVYTLWISYVQAACVLVSAEVFQALGGLNPPVKHGFFYERIIRKKSTIFQCTLQPISCPFPEAVNLYLIFISPKYKTLDNEKSQEMQVKLCWSSL